MTMIYVFYCFKRPFDFGVINLIEVINKWKYQIQSSISLKRLNYKEECKVCLLIFDRINGIYFYSPHHKKFHLLFRVSTYFARIIHATVKVRLGISRALHPTHIFRAISGIASGIGSLWGGDQQNGLWREKGKRAKATNSTFEVENGRNYSIDLKNVILWSIKQKNVFYAYKEKKLRPQSQKTRKSIYCL